ncbi:MAG: exported protein of unknown function [Candidatus Thorarchaeota archaeon]|nr:MAG: exported protein of unknown function [Candidatus Thorarchaeota archaeon]
MRHIECFVILLLFLASSFVIAHSSPQLLYSKEDSLVVFSSYEEFHPIYVNGDKELLEAASENEWIGDGSQANPIMIEGYSITGISWLIRVENVRLYFEVAENRLNGYDSDWSSILVRNSTNFTIRDNLVHNGTTGIRILNCSNFEIRDNTVMEEYTALYVTNCSASAIITRNLIHDCRSVGIAVLDCTGDLEDGFSIYENIIENLTAAAIYVRHSRYISISTNHIRFIEQTGIILSTDDSSWLYGSQCTISENNVQECSIGLSIMTSNNLVNNNTIQNCTGECLRLQSASEPDLSSSDNTVVWNIFALSQGYGVVIESGCRNNTFSQNDYILNTLTPQASDDGAFNTFRDNHYSDHTSPDFDNDLVVDTVYDLDGESENFDVRPNLVPHRLESILIMNQFFSRDNPFQFWDLVRIALSSILSAIFAIGIIAFVARRKNT